MVTGYSATEVNTATSEATSRAVQIDLVVAALEKQKRGLSGVTATLRAQNFYQSGEQQSDIPLVQVDIPREMAIYFLPGAKVRLTLLPVQDPVAR